MDLERKIAMEEGIDYAKEAIKSMVKDIHLLKSLDSQTAALADSYTSILCSNVTINQLFVSLNELIIEKDEDLGIYDLMMAIHEFMNAGRRELTKQHNIFEQSLNVNEKALLN